VPGLPDGLAEALSSAASCSTLVVATDFDGVLAPIVLDPMSSRPVDGSIEDLRRLAARPGVHVAVVSGRDLATLSELTGVELDGPIRLVGSHGAESSTGRDWGALTPSQAAILTRLTRQVRGLRESARGIRIEYKPSAIVVHTRGLDEDERSAATKGAKALGRQPGVHLKKGKDVVELTVVRADKGTAVMDLAAEVHADAVVYLGDDATDEDVFERLGPDDVGIKVGPGETAAKWRVDGPDEAAAVLHLL
jgi:trehalose 6-phosphate phosphatase